MGLTVYSLILCKTICYMASECTCLWTASYTLTKPNLDRLQKCYGQVISTALVSRIHMHTCIIGHYNPSEWKGALNLYVSGGTYSLTPTSNNRFFGKVFHGKFIYSKNLLRRNSRRIFFSYFVLMPDLGYEPRLYA